eukprot:symbB.v1.2.015192.t1/scaffold1044.1/size142232/13
MYSLEMDEPDFDGIEEISYAGLIESINVEQKARSRLTKQLATACDMRQELEHLLQSLGIPRLQKQLFQVGAEVQRGSLFGRLRRENDPKEMSAIVEHLLYENLMFHHRHFTMALNSLGRSSLWPLALDLLPEMQHRDLVPNTITYNAAMDACRK